MNYKTWYFAFKILGLLFAIGAFLAFVHVSPWAVVGVIAWSCWKSLDEAGDTMWKEYIAEKRREPQHGPKA